MTLDQAKSVDESIATLSAAAAKLVATVQFLEGPFFAAQLVEGMQAAVIRSTSPWLNRKDAAEYARCSTSEIDRAGEERIITKYMRGGAPMFLKSQIDEAIRSGVWSPGRKKAA